MLKKAADMMREVYYFLPVQLLVTQIRSHKFILLLWLLLYLTIGNNFGKTIGLSFLFLEPEYLGEVSFTSMLLLGIGLGAMIVSYNIATYISDSYMFHFLALEKRPFRSYVLNNFLIPAGLVVLYTISFLSFESHTPEGITGKSVLYLSGFYLGLLSVAVLITLYFSRTNTTPDKVLGEAFMKEFRSRRVILGKAKRGISQQARVDSYIGANFRILRPDSSNPAEFRELVRILNQHHGNALFISLIFILSVMSAGLLERNPHFQVPAGMSILVLFSIILLLVSGLNFWLRKLGPLLLLVAVIAVFAVYNPMAFQRRSEAPGLSYSAAPAPYTIQRIFDLADEKNFLSDVEFHESILNRWKADYELFHTPGEKPKMVIIAVSGGGLRSTYFTFRALQIADSMTGGELLDNTRFVTGASGGMIGAGYYRELYLRKKRRSIPAENVISGMQYADNVSSDLLNRVSFKITTGLFLPALKNTVGDEEYASDRGWSWDDQLMTNLPELRDVRLCDYRDAEREALIPVLVLSPVVINDGRKLFVCSSPVSFLCRNTKLPGGVEKGVTGIEFRRFFEKQDADSLLFATALRMNASFPIITPYIQLPSDPPMKLIDAGIADNYGMQASADYLYVFADWIQKNTDGVLLLQIRDSEQKSMTLPNEESSSLISQLLDPIGATYNSFAMSRDHLNEDYLQAAENALKGKLTHIRLEYSGSDSTDTRASLSWHLTEREKENIEEALRNPQNSKSLNALKDWLNPDPHANLARR